MAYSVLVPVSTKDLQLHVVDIMKLAIYFSARCVPVIFLVNGPECEEAATAFGEALVPVCNDAYVLPVGDTANPYVARNAGLRCAFYSRRNTHAVLLDSDVYPKGDYVIELNKLLDSDPEGKLLIAGRTMTKIPDVNTFHFNKLRAANFECYDGFTPPDHTVGSNMVIGFKVFEELGAMRESVVSGGDGCYGIEWKKLGHEVTVGSSLIVEKTVHGMDFKGVVEKQFRRACCYPPEMLPDMEDVREALQHECGVLVWLLADKQDLLANYSTFVDRMFKLMMRLGQLRQHLDKAE